VFETKHGFFYLLTMLQFKQDNSAAVMILTLTEFVTIPAPYYLFVFAHVETKNVVVFVKSEADDESLYPQRYNQFTIDAAAVFLDQPTSEWHYKVYEQASAVNIDPAAAGDLLEEGKLILDRATEFAYTQYDSSTSYKVYNG
jgi:hypothetical protein